MTLSSSVHGSFVIERRYPVPPARVYAAWARPEIKRRWLSCDDAWVLQAHEMDFRVGGRERNRVGPAGGPVHAFDGVYHDIVPGERVVYSYAMTVGGERISVSLATVEFHPDGAGTRMVFTEHGVYLDGHQTPAEREAGTAVGLANLAAVLAGEPAPA